MTALMAAVRHCDPRAVSKLISLGADAQLLDEEGRSALSIATDIRQALTPDKSKGGFIGQTGSSSSSGSSSHSNPAEDAARLKNINEIVILLHHASAAAARPSVLKLAFSASATTLEEYVTDIYCISAKNKIQRIDEKILSDIQTDDSTLVTILLARLLYCNPAS